MIQFALVVRLTAKQGKELELENFLKSALPLAQAEPDTITWYAVKIDEATFGIFDTFPHEEGRQSHLAGKIAAALMEQAPDLLATEPIIEKAEVLAAQVPVS